jgi:hypothetical protein
MKRPIK